MEALASSQTLSSAERALQGFMGQYRGIRVLVLPFTTPGFLTFPAYDFLDEVDLPALIAYGRLFICEWAKYSPLWVDSSNIARFALVKNLNHPVGLGCKESGLAGQKMVYQDVICTRDDPVFQKHTMHHEFWHLMAATAHGTGAYDDPAWSGLNDPGFSYGHSGWDPVTGWNPEAHLRSHGFVTVYATQNEGEDEAETYAFLFVREERIQLRDWMATDAVLQGKFEYLKQFIHSKDPAMDAAYLEGAAR